MMRKRGGFLGGRLLTMALACVLASSTCVAVAMGADTAPSTEPAKIATGGALSSTPDDQSADDADAGISAQKIETEEDKKVLAANTVKGLNPAATTVNLFNYNTNWYGSQGDVNGTTGSQTQAQNIATWLTPNGNNINHGRVLAFGDGMRYLGYWNQGLVKNYGTFADAHPGMQNIVSQLLVGGYPVLNAAGSPGVSTAETAGYNGNPTIYQDATYKDKDGNTVVVYTKAGGKNISDAVQELVGGASSNSDKIGHLTEEELSLSYLFDPNTSSDQPNNSALYQQGKKSYTNVTDLFQIDAEGYYYYNMRKNFAEFVNDPVYEEDEEGNRKLVSSGHFILYNKPAGLRTDGKTTPNTQEDPGDPSIGNFFPFNTGAQVFKVVGDEIENAVRADNVQHRTTGTWGTAGQVVEGNEGVFIDHHLGMTVETDFLQPTDGIVGNKDMTFEFVGDDDMWVFIDDVLVLDLGGIHSEVYGTINFATGEIALGTAYNTNGEIYNENGNYLTEPVTTSTIKAQFAKAGRADNTNDWNGNTFASNTSHTLKMFYLERGNYDSSLSIKFNLQPALYQQIKKVDQDGKPLEGAKFNLYALNTPEGVTTDNADEVTLEDEAIDNQVKSIGSDSEVFASLTTDANGEAIFQKADGDPCNFSDEYTRNNGRGLLYLLREAEPPAGYKKPRKTFF